MAFAAAPVLPLTARGIPSLFAAIGVGPGRGGVCGRGGLGALVVRASSRTSLVRVLEVEPRPAGHFRTPMARTTEWIAGSLYEAAGAAEPLLLTVCQSAPALRCEQDRS